MTTGSSLRTLIIATAFTTGLLHADGVEARAEGPQMAMASAGLDDPAADPAALYGDRLKFGVYRDGKRVGFHDVTFRTDGPATVVDIRFEVDVTFLIFSAYTFTYSAQERWKDGDLVALNAYTNDNGDGSRVTARLNDGALRIDGPSGAAAADPGIFATNHWHPGVLESDVVLNSITGELSRVRIIDKGVEQVRVEGNTIPARRFAYTGDLDNEVWYDSQGRWVKMRFKAKDGSTIEYVCEQIGRPGASS